MMKNQAKQNAITVLKGLMVNNVLDKKDIELILA